MWMGSLADAEDAGCSLADLAGGHLHVRQAKTPIRCKCCVQLEDATKRVFLVGYRSVVHNATFFAAEVH